MKISEILAKYETDKVNGHCYGDAYDEIFGRFDREAALNIFEVGTQKGGSLLAWKEYFPNAKVTGIDIIDVVKPEYRSDQIGYIVSDVKNHETDEEFDIIIDDGSHFLGDVLYVVDSFRLKKGGVMVIEDVQDPDEWTRVISQRKDISFIDLREVNGNYDDYLILIYND